MTHMKHIEGAEGDDRFHGYSANLCRNQHWTAMSSTAFALSPWRFPVARGVCRPASGLPLSLRTPPPSGFLHSRSFDVGQRFPALAGAITLRSVPL